MYRDAFREGPGEDAATIPCCDDVRCECGNLLARLVMGGVEVKCRRCKRTVVLPIDQRP